MSRIAAMFFFFVLLSVDGGVGQGTDPIQPGTRVRFVLDTARTPGDDLRFQRTIGTVLAVSEDELTIAVRGRVEALNVPLSSALDLEFQRAHRPSTVHGARIGAVLGAVLGVAVGVGVFDGGCAVHVGGSVACPTVGAAVGGIGGSVVGIAVGFLLGKLLRKDPWEAVDPKVWKDRFRPRGNLAAVSFDF